MKKLSIIVIMAVMAAATLFSCKDETGDYVEQLYTNGQKELAIKACLRVSADTATAHLFVPNGFYMYNDSSYRIDFVPLQSTLFSNLESHGYGDLVDSLILHVNRMAESCGNQVNQSLKAAVDSLKILDCDALINGDDDAITRYYEMCEYKYLKSSIQTPVTVRMDFYGVNGIWDEMLHKYYLSTGNPLNFDIVNYIVETMLAGIIKEMSKEEAFIRSDEDRRTDDMDAFGIE